MGVQVSKSCAGRVGDWPKSVLVGVQASKSCFGRVGDCGQSLVWWVYMLLSLVLGEWETVAKVSLGGCTGI